MSTQFLNMIPVLPSSDLERDIEWYEQMTGFECLYKEYLNDTQTLGYAVLGRNSQFIHLQWHADTKDDPLLGGSVVRIYVKNIKPLFDEFVERGTVKADSFEENTPWRTNEFGFCDLNKNAIFIMENI